LNNKESSTFCCGDVIFTIPVFGVSCWSLLLFTPREFLCYPSGVGSCDQNIFLEWTFVFSLWAGPALDEWICDVFSFSTIVKGFLPVSLSTENTFISSRTAISTIVESNSST